MAETLIQKAQRLGIQPAVQPTESLIQKAQRLGIKPAVQTDGQNYFERVGGQFGRIGGELTSALKTGGENYLSNANKGNIFKATGSLLRSGLRAVGAVAEGSATPILEAPIIKQLTEKVVGRTLEIPGAKDVVTKATEIAKKYPNASKDIQNIIDIATLGGGKAIESPAIKETRLIGRDVVEGSRALLVPSEEAVQRSVVELFNKSIKPSMKSVAKGERYQNDIVNALRTIKTNANQLNLEDASGELVSRTPESVQELAQALDQTKSLVFKQYDAIAKKAGATGVVIDASPIAEEVLKVAKNKALQITNPEVIKYAENWAERLQGLDVLDPETTQAVIQNLNNSLKAFYRNPTYEAASKAAVDAGIVNNFRQMLDKAIENATGEQYQVLKNQYSALKAIEDDVVRAAARDVRKNVKGLLDYSDIFTSGQMIGGIFSLNPAMFTKGAIERGFKEYFKFLNDPNRAVQNIFDNLDINTSIKFTPQSSTGKFMANPKLGLSIEDVSKGAYKGEKDLTTKILRDLEGKTTVSKQYILDATNRGELKQVERDLVRSVLEREKDIVNVADFAKKVKAELLPLKTLDKSNYGNTYNITRYENITLPTEVRGKVKDYRERIYQSPIKTSAGQTHFNSLGIDDYFGHTRIEDMADNQTRRVIEVQSDLYQKGNLEREGINLDYLPENKQKLDEARKRGLESGLLKEKDFNPEMDARARDAAIKRQQELSKLQQYNDPTAHFRMVREEIKKAAQDGKTKLQFPTGETAMKIEGLGEESTWVNANDYRLITRDRMSRQAAADHFGLRPEDLKVGKDIKQFGDENNTWIITDVLGDGKFKAVPKNYVANSPQVLKSPEITVNGEKMYYHPTMVEQFDISGKVDTNNPIYRFYEKDMQKYLNKFDGKRVVDDKGVSWIEVPIKKEWAKMPVEAFALIGGVGLASQIKN